MTLHASAGRVSRRNVRRRRSSVPHKLGADAGYSTAELVAGLAVLVLPVALLVLTFPTWAERRALADAAAREASVVVANAKQWTSGKAAAEHVVREMTQNYGLPAGSVRLTWDPDGGTARLRRGEPVRAVVAVPMPLIVVPGMVAIGAWETTAAHTEIVPQYGSR